MTENTEHGTDPTTNSQMLNFSYRHVSNSLALNQTTEIFPFLTVAQIEFNSSANKRPPFLGQLHHPRA